MKKKCLLKCGLVLALFYVNSPRVAAQNIYLEKDVVTGPIKSIYKIPHVKIKNPAYVMHYPAICECHVLLAVKRYTAMTPHYENATGDLLRCEFSDKLRPFAVDCQIEPNVNTYFVPQFNYYLGIMVRDALRTDSDALCPPFTTLAKIESLTELRIIGEILNERIGFSRVWVPGKVKHPHLEWFSGRTTMNTELGNDYRQLHVDTTDKPCVFLRNELKLETSECQFDKDANYICSNSTSAAP